ncbi:hypothetical protein [Hymenobacter amundsenii]|uniref:hypothetical protein n=1 Tax=Hymenobacter amundsenii TaxID=2006685 RepID=UPI000F825235|nr:hypothetical protein [Hymenobacter amundsenii]
MKVLVFPVLLAIAIMVGPPKMDVAPVAKTAIAQPSLVLERPSEATLTTPNPAALMKSTAAAPKNRLTDETNPQPKSSTARR